MFEVIKRCALLLTIGLCIVGLALHFMVESLGGIQDHPRTAEYKEAHLLPYSVGSIARANVSAADRLRRTLSFPGRPGGSHHALPAELSRCRERRWQTCNIIDPNPIVSAGIQFQLVIPIYHICIPRLHYPSNSLARI